MYAVTGFLVFALAAAASNLVAGQECEGGGVMENCRYMMKEMTDELRKEECVQNWWDKQDIPENYHEDMGQVKDLIHKFVDYMKGIKESGDKEKFEKCAEALHEKAKDMHKNLWEKVDDDCKAACKKTIDTIMCK